MTKSFTEFAEITGTSVKDSVSSVTDVLNKWNIPAEQAPELLDQLTKASQLSGVSVTELAGNLKSGGAQFQELGLSLTDATALMAAFGKDGVNTQVVLTGLRTAVRDYAKEGVDATTALQETFDQIKNAKDPTDALTIAISTFGSKAGPEMANAIRTGKASIDDFKTAIGEAGGTVEKTAGASETLGEKWSATMNQLKSAFAPLGDLLVELAKVAVGAISDIIKAFQNLVGPIFNNLKTGIATTKGEFNDFFDLIGNLIHGNWNAAWKDAELIVLNLVKSVTDSLSSIINVFIGTINNLINASDKVLDKVKLHIDDIKTVSLSAALGIDAAIKNIQDSIETTNTKMENLGKTTQTVASGMTAAQKKAIEEDQANTDKALSDREKSYEKYFADLKKKYGDQSASELIDIDKRSKAEEDAYKNTADNAVGSSRIIETAGTSTMSTLTAAWLDFTNDAKAQGLSWESTMLTAFNTISSSASSSLETMGKDLVAGGNAWKDMAKIALQGLSNILDSIGAQLAAMAVVKLVSLDFADATIAAAGAAAAYIAAGMVNGLAGQLATGIEYSAAGTYLVGDQGPELVSLSQGSKVTNAVQTAAALSGSGSTGSKTNNFNIYAGQNLSAADIARQVKRTSRQMAFQGVL
jgi:hypothetical protein